MIKKAFLKIISLLLIIGMNWSAISLISGTDACFNDVEMSTDNVYIAGTLDFSLRSQQGDFAPLIIAKNMKPGDAIARNIYVKKECNSTLQYKARSEFVSGNCDEELYNILELKIWYRYYTAAPLDDYNENLAKILRYNGLLKDFDDFGTNPNDPDLQIPNDHPHYLNDFYGEDEHWLTFSITLPESVPEDALEELQNRSCEFKFVFDGWQSDSVCGEGNGFIDEEEIYSGLVSHGLRINEVYYNVDKDHGTEGNNEWVEIYNQADEPIDITDWIIEDDKQEDIILSSFCDPSCEIPAQGYALITKKDATWDYWPIPPAAVKIALGKQIGNGLNKKGDRIILKRPDGTEVDAMSYGDDGTIFELDGVPEGHSLGRNPDGYDTDRASDWSDQGGHSPSPGWSNWIRVEVPNGGEVWYMVPESYGLTWCQNHGWKYGMNENCEYLIKWSSNIPKEEGDYSDFEVDIWFCNENGENCFYNITEDNPTENDGIYEWRIPLSDMFYGDDERIKIIVNKNGTEKSAWDMTDRDFCPLIPPYEPSGGGSGSESPAEETDDSDTEENFSEGIVIEEEETNEDEEDIEDEDGEIEDEEIENKESDNGEKKVEKSDDGDKNNESDSADESETDNPGKEDDDADAKDEEVVIISKEKNLPDDGSDDDDSDDDSDDFEQEGSTQENGVDDDAIGSTVFQDYGASDKDKDNDMDANDADAEENDDDTNAKDEEVVLISEEKNLPDDGDGDGDDANDDSDDVNGSTQENGTNDGLNKNMVDSVQVFVDL